MNRKRTIAFTLAGTMLAVTAVSSVASAANKNGCGGGNSGWGISSVGTIDGYTDGRTIGNPNRDGSFYCTRIRSDFVQIVGAEFDF